MAQIWKPLEVEVYQSWINDIIEEASDELNDWESNFVSDMQVRCANGWKLTQGQAEKLESIYVKYTN